MRSAPIFSVRPKRSSSGCTASWTSGDGEDDVPLRRARGHFDERLTPVKSTSSIASARRTSHRGGSGHIDEARISSENREAFA